LTKSSVEAALNEAVKTYNDRINAYIISSCDESLKEDYRQLSAATMECFADFEEVIIKLAD